MTTYIGPERRVLDPALEASVVTIKDPILGKSFLVRTGADVLEVESYEAARLAEARHNFHWGHWGDRRKHLRSVS